MIPDRAVRKQAGFQREILKARLLAVVSVDTDLESPLEMIHLDQFAGHCVCGTLWRKLAVDDLEPFGFIAWF